jgi:flagellar assembly protein FliH
MAKNVFRAEEVLRTDGKVYIQSPFEPIIEKQDQVVEVYTGPSVDDLRREAEAFKAGWEKEKASMIEAAKAEADGIINEAEDKAFQEVKKRSDEVEKQRQKMEDELAVKQQDIERLVAEMRTQAESEVDTIRETARKQGYEEGHAAGYEEGRKEVERLIEQLHRIIDASLEKRRDIIEETESQLVNLVLLSAKKVVKVISENQKNVVVNNVIQALRKLKSRGDVVIKVNLQDVELTSDHVKDFMRMVENVRSITVVEDTTVDPGGCLIETDFGEIDARISSQFRAIEEKIIELAPIKSKGERQNI